VSFLLLAQAYASIYFCDRSVSLLQNKPPEQVFREFSEAAEHSSPAGKESRIPDPLEIFRTRQKVPGSITSDTVNWPSST